MGEVIQILDTTLRDGEQTRGVSFSLQEKLAVSKMLLQELKVDRLEIASARVSEGEKESVASICKWAEEENYNDKLEVLGFVDKNLSVDWVKETGCNTLNLLAKGSLKHCKMQLGKTPEQHFSDVAEVVDYANTQGVNVNVYLEDWSNGINDSKEYVFDFAKKLSELKINRLMLPDTLGVLGPTQIKKFIGEMADVYLIGKMDFHAHNDYGLATANTLVAVEEGITNVHCTVNGLGERTGNAPMADVVAGINDKTEFHSNVNESALVKVSKFVERISGKKVPSNKPIVGADVFTQTAGIHADGDAKGNLYVNPLNPDRFGRKREYSLGKLSGKASLDHNLKELNIELTPEQKKLVLKRIIELGDKKETITPEDLPFIISDVLKTPLEKKVQIIDFDIHNSFKGKPKVRLKIKFNGSVFEQASEGDGSYNAFMNALTIVTENINLELPKLIDYEVRIPPGGNSDAIVEAIITWKQGSREFKTVGVDSDQIIAAIKSTEKMLNQLSRK